MKKLSILAVVLAAFAIPASAADLGSPIKQVAPDFDVRKVTKVDPWTGVYGGAHGTYAWGTSDIAISVEEESSKGIGDIQAGGFGLHLGYRALMSGLLFGLEGDVTYGGAGGIDNNCAGLADIIDASSTCDVRTMYSASVVAKAGIPLGHLHVYGLAGYSWAEIDVDATLDGDTASDRNTAKGWVYGAGGEYLINERFSLALEWRRGLLDYDLSEALGEDDASLKHKLETDSISLRANVRF